MMKSHKLAPNVTLILICFIITEVIFGVKNVLDYVQVAIQNINAIVVLTVPNYKMGYVHTTPNTKYSAFKFQTATLSVELKVSSWVILEK